MQSSLPNFKNTEPSGSETEDVFILHMYFYAANPGARGIRPFWTLRPWFEQTWLRTTRQCYIPNFKHLRQVVLKKKIFEYFSMYFYDLNLGPPSVGPSWSPGPWFERTW